MKSTRQANNSANSSTSGKNQHAVRENLKQLDAEETKETKADAKAESKVDVKAEEKSESKSDGSDASLSGFEKLSASLNEATGGAAQPAIAQGKKVYEQAVITLEEAKEVYSHVRETVVMGKSALETCKTSATKAFAHVRKNPQPFFEAIVPGAVGTLLMADRFRTKVMDRMSSAKSSGAKAN